MLKIKKCENKRKLMLLLVIKRSWIGKYKWIINKWIK